MMGMGVSGDIWLGAIWVKYIMMEKTTTNDDQAVPMCDNVLPPSLLPNHHQVPKTQLCHKLR